MDTITFSNSDIYWCIGSILVAIMVFAWDIRKNNAKLLKVVISQAINELQEELNIDDGAKLQNFIKCVKMKLPFIFRIFISEKLIVKTIISVLDDIKPKQDLNVDIGPNKIEIKPHETVDTSDKTGELYLQGTTDLKGDSRIELGIKKKF